MRCWDLVFGCWAARSAGVQNAGVCVINVKEVMLLMTKQRTHTHTKTANELHELA